MKLLQKILVPVDFGRASENALQAAAGIAREFNSEIVALHVIDDEQVSGKTEALMKDFLKEKFDALKSSLPGEMQERVSFSVEKGVVFHLIAKIALEGDFNVIISGSGSDDNDTRYPLGTTVEKLMRKNQVPLWVVRPGDSFPAKRILCPVDFSDASERALNNAILLASRFKAELEVLHIFTPIVIQSPRISNDSEKENEELRAVRRSEFEAFVSGFDFGAVKYHTTMAEGTPDREILKKIRSGSFDLLIMGTTGRTGLSRILMGSITEKVTRELPVSFITTKSKDITRTVFDSNLTEIESILEHASAFRKKQDYDKAIEYYQSGLRQFPDNVPILLGLRDCYNSLGIKEKAKYYHDNAAEVVRRVWGPGYISKFGLDK